MCLTIVLFISCCVSIYFEKIGMILKILCFCNALFTVATLVAICKHRNFKHDILFWLYFFIIFFFSPLTGMIITPKI
jgi:hypothetical protein